MKEPSGIDDTQSSAAAPCQVRRRFTGALLVSAIMAPLAGVARAQSYRPAIEVWTGPGCACCHDWISHLEQNSFEVVSHDGGNQQARERLGMPVRYGSCHSAEAGRYAIEGHVPAREIIRLLEERPDAIGLSVPAMPRGAPGMDGPAYRGIEDPYDVLLVGRDGSASVFESYR